jgi:hypothetical protein
MKSIPYEPAGTFDAAGFRAALAADPELRRFARAALRGFESLDDLTACLGSGSGGDASASSRPARRDDGGTA